MLDRETLSHLNQRSGKLPDQSVNKISLYSADDTVIPSTHVDIRRTDIRNENGDLEYSLTDTVVVRHASLSLPPISTLSRMDIEVLKTQERQRIWTSEMTSTRSSMQQT